MLPYFLHLHSHLSYLQSYSLFCTIIPVNFLQHCFFFFLNSVKGDKNAIAEKAIGLQVEQMAVQVQNIWQQGGWVQKAGTSAKVRSRVWGEIAWSDRGFEGNRRAQVADF